MEEKKQLQLGDEILKYEMHKPSDFLVILRVTDTQAIAKTTKGEIRFKREYSNDYIREVGKRSLISTRFYLANEKSKKKFFLETKRLKIKEISISSIEDEDIEKIYEILKKYVK